MKNRTAPDCSEAALKFLSRGRLMPAEYLRSYFIEAADGY
jgi:hypothetical protein